MMGRRDGGRGRGWSREGAGGLGREGVGGPSDPGGPGRSAGGARDAFSPEVVCGRNPVIEALRGGRPIHKILVQRGGREGSIRLIEALARERGVVVQDAAREKLDAMSGGGGHQGVVAVAAAKECGTLGDILAVAEGRGEPPFVVVADGVEDPHNLGAIVRTAEAVGAHGVAIPKRRAAGLTPAVAKAAAGALEYVVVARVANVSEAIRELKKRGLWVFGADAAAPGALPYTECDFTGGLALVVGGEGEGLSRLARENCDFLARVPMRGRIPSLNAAVAASVLMYEALRQRGGEAGGALRQRWGGGGAGGEAENGAGKV
jgi:23S rRNA (guanosine2251-2'-O)-methyltransferase